MIHNGSISERLQRLASSTARVGVAGRYSTKNSAQVAATSFRKREPGLVYKVRPADDEHIVVATRPR